MTVSSTKSESIDAKRYPHLSEERRVALAATARQDLLAQDLAGIEALIKDLSTHAATEDRCYLSGFSMGGFLAWHAAFRRPDLLHAILPSCPCFDPASVPDRIPDGFTSLPILVLQGQQDTLLEKVLEPAWMQAKAAVAKANHLGVLRLMTVRNHSWHYEEIQQFCYGHVLARTTSRR
jgi:predicted esterase